MSWRTLLALAAAAGLRLALIQRYFPGHEFWPEDFALRPFLTDVTAYFILFALCLGVINIFADWYEGRQ